MVEERERGGGVGEGGRKTTRKITNNKERTVLCYKAWHGQQPKHELVCPGNRSKY